MASVTVEMEFEDSVYNYSFTQIWKLYNTRNVSFYDLEKDKRYSMRELKQLYKQKLRRLGHRR